MIKLLLPIRDVFVIQPFGVNYLDFYKQWGLKGHPGIDFRARHGCPVRAAHGGEVTFSQQGADGGVGVEIWDRLNKIKTFYYHHKTNNVVKGDIVKAGQIIALADNTGKYTTGDHEHFEVYHVDANGNTLNTNNGFRGSVDPAPYLAAMHGEQWEKPASYHRYGRKQEWLAEWMMRFKNAWLHRKLTGTGQLNKIYDTCFINRLVYGYWSFEDAINPAMNQITDYLKKAEYLDGQRPFER
jgi:hypothetical protein